MNVFLGVHHLQIQHLGDDKIGRQRIHGRAEEHDAVHQQARVNVVAALTASGLLNDHGNEEIIHKKLFSGAKRNGGNTIGQARLCFTSLSFSYSYSEREQEYEKESE